MAATLATACWPVAFAGGITLETAISKSESVCGKPNGIQARPQAFGTLGT